MKSIRSKILLTVLAVSVGSIAVVAAVTLVNLWVSKKRVHY